MRYKGDNRFANNNLINVFKKKDNLINSKIIVCR